MRDEDVDAAVGRFYADVGARVRSARHGRTQDQLARGLGMTRSSVANLEAGRQRIPLHVLFLIAEVLGVSPMSLVPEELSVAVPVEVELRDDLPASSREFVLACLANVAR